MSDYELYEDVITRLLETLKIKYEMSICSYRYDDKIKDNFDYAIQELKMIICHALEDTSLIEVRLNTNENNTLFFRYKDNLKDDYYMKENFDLDQIYSINKLAVLIHILSIRSL